LRHSVFEQPELCFISGELTIAFSAKLQSVSLGHLLNEEGIRGIAVVAIPWTLGINVASSVVNPI
jgi:hypothetical protein